MINRITDIAQNNRMLTVLLWLIALAVGWRSMPDLPVDAARTSPTCRCRS